MFAAGVFYHKNCVASFISKFQVNVNKIFEGNNEYFQIRVVIEALIEVVITLEESRKAIQYLTFEKY